MIKSMFMSFHGAEGIGNGVYKRALIDPSFHLWQIWHLSTGRVTSLLKFDQKYLLLISEIIVSQPNYISTCFSVTIFIPKEYSGT